MILNVFRGKYRPMEISDAHRRLEIAAQRIFAYFKKSGLTLCAAESCTGGLLGSSIVSIAGASAIFKGSAVCYCDDAKISILGVDRALIETHFAESRECAIAMARGALQIFAADAAISTTGFLDANVGNKPANLGGKVFVCATLKTTDGIKDYCACVSLDANADRNLNRIIAATCALESLSLTLK